MLNMSEKKFNKSIQKHEKNIEKLMKQQNGKFVNEIRQQQLQDKINEEQYMISLYERILDGDDSARDELHQAFVDRSAFTKASKNFEVAGDKLQSAGKDMMKFGMHATGAVWAPPVYLAYQGIKHARKKPKNETIEQDLIELVQEVEKAHKDGNITEEQKRDFIIDFVENYYKK